MEKFCTKCGKKFAATGREVICPTCKAQAAEESKKVAVMRAKRASWNGESVPVRISGRASTYVRAWAARRGLTFVESLDSILQLTEAISCFKEMWEKEKWKEWQDITPYKSHRRDKHATENKQEAPQAAKTVKTVKAKKAVKTVKTAAGKKA